MKIKKYFSAILFCAITILLLSSCKKTPKFEGKVYYHDADTLAYIVSFEKDTMLYIIRGPKMNASHRSKFTTKTVNDSTFLIELEKKPAFWTQTTWEIRMAMDTGFFSTESNKYYKFTPDKGILR